MKKREEKVKEDEKKIDKYLAEKELLAQKEEKDLLLNKRKNQKMIRDFYDKQVKEKKERELHEKNIVIQLIISFNLTIYIFFGRLFFILLFVLLYSVLK